MHSTTLANDREREYITVTDLRRRGWNDNIISMLLCAPDQTKPNPYYRSGAPMKLYLRSRVHSAERDVRFINHLDKWQKHSAAAIAAAATKRAETMRHAKSRDISVPLMSLDKLSASARDHYNCHHSEAIDTGKKEPAAFAVWGKPDQFRNRICVNYLRHAVTQYDHVLASLDRRAVGKGDARLLLLKIIGKKISAAYPELSEEVKRQLSARK